MIKKRACWCAIITVWFFYKPLLNLYTVNIVNLFSWKRLMNKATCWLGEFPKSKSDIVSPWLRKKSVTNRNQINNNFFLNFKIFFRHFHFQSFCLYNFFEYHFFRIVTRLQPLITVFIIKKYELLNPSISPGGSRILAYFMTNL